MRFCKGSFYILRCDGTVQLVTGWIDSTSTYGFHKLERKSNRTNNSYTWKWVATDIASGLRIIKADTRAKCVKWIEEHEEKIGRQRNLSSYLGYVEERNRRIYEEKIFKA